MGGWFESQFRKAGMDPVISDLDDSSLTQSVIASFDVVMLAVPIPAVMEVMKSIGSYLRRDTAVIDISSIKREPVNHMLEYSHAEVIGSHPMFGPSVPSFSGQVMFLCPARIGKWTDPFRHFLNDQGATVNEIDPDDHDRLMACAQSLRHVMLTALGKTLSSLGFDLQRDLPVSGLWFQQLMGMMTHQFEQPAELYAHLAIENQYSDTAIRCFHENLLELVDMIQTGDRAGLIRAMGSVAGFVASNEAVSKDSSWGWRDDKGGGSRHMEV
jgi:prephenate dehydrogenase